MGFSEQPLEQDAGCCQRCSHQCCGDDTGQPDLEEDGLIGCLPGGVEIGECYLVQGHLRYVQRVYGYRPDSGSGQQTQEQECC